MKFSEKLCEIFKTCAGHENNFWQAAYNCL